MPANTKDGGAAEAGFAILLRYADVLGHKINTTHAATAAGLARTTAHGRMASAKQKITEKLMSPQLSIGLPVLIKYAELSGLKLSATPLATALGIPRTTAFGKLSQAKSDSKISEPETNAGDTQPEHETSEPVKNSSRRPGSRSKRNAEAQADTQEEPATAKANSGKKRDFGVANDQNISVVPMGNPVVVIHTRVPSQEANEVQVPDETMNQSTIKHNDGVVGKDCVNVKDGAETTVQGEPPAKKKRGRPAKKSTGAASPSLPQSNEDDNKTTTNAGDANNNCVTIGRDEAEIEEPPKKKRGRPPKNANEKTTPAQPETSSGDGTAKVEGREEMEGVEDTTDSLVDQYIDFGKGETAVAEAQKEAAEEDDAWPFA